MRLVEPDIKRTSRLALAVLLNHAGLGCALCISLGSPCCSKVKLPGVTHTVIDTPAASRLTVHSSPKPTLDSPEQG